MSITQNKHSDKETFKIIDNELKDLLNEKN